MEETQREQGEQIEQVKQREEEKQSEQKNLEFMLTRLEVTSQGELYAGFRNLGGVYFPNWNHWFVTEILGRNSKEEDELKEAQENDERVMRKIQANPKLKGFQVKPKRKYWWTRGIKCPVNLKGELPEEFVRGHYTQQARWRTSVPGNYVSLNEETLFALEKKAEIQVKITELETKLRAGRKKAQATRILNDLNDLFEDYDRTNYETLVVKAKECSSTKELSREFFDLRKNIADEIENANTRLAAKARIIYKKTSQASKSRERELRVEQYDWEYLTRTRTPSASELLSKKWLFLDIEIPYFRRENPRITWVGLTYAHKGEVRREIHTIHDTGEEEINGFRIVRHKNEDELVRAVANGVNRENPDFVSSYNTRFDLIKLRESSAGFHVGEEESEPVFKVTTPFFERIGIKDRFVIDFLRWQKIARAFDINAKLEMAAGFEKEIDYDELERNETRTYSGDRKAALESARYLAGDVEHLTGLFFSREFRDNLEDALWISQNFRVGLERLMHSADCVNDAQERGYFSELGIYREEVPPHLRTKKMNYLKTRARQDFTEEILARRFKGREKEGLFQDVHKVYVPVGSFFEELLQRRFGDIRSFFEYKSSVRGDKKRLFFLEQYAKEFARWITEDYGFYIREARFFEKLFSEIGREKGGVGRQEFEDIYHGLRRKLGASSKQALRQLDEERLSQRNLQANLTEEASAFLLKYDLDIRDFTRIANQRSAVKRRGRNIIGNYDVFPSREFFNPEKHRVPSDIAIIDETLEARLKEIGDFLSLNGLDMICCDGRYLYVQGNREALEREDAPVVLVDEIPRLYNADNPYYQKFGFFSNIKLKDEPDIHLNVFEMRLFREILEKLIEGRNSEAISAYERGLKMLDSGKVGIRNLLFYNKSSRRYSACINNSGSKNGKIYFVENRQDVPKDRVILSDERGSYFVEEERGKEVKVYIIGIEDIAPDKEKYRKRFEKRAREILAPVISKSSEKVAVQGELALELR